MERTRRREKEREKASARVPRGLFASPSGYQLACSSRSTAAIVRRIVRTAVVVSS